MMDGLEIEQAHQQYFQAEKEILFAQITRMEQEQIDDEEREEIRTDILNRIEALCEESKRLGVYLADRIAVIDEAQTRLQEVDRISKSGKRMIHPAPTNAQIDYAEKQRGHFAQGMSGYKLFWVFFIGCFVGVVVERLWALVRYGVLEPRVGLVLGPFNLVYGLGAAALSVVLYPVRNRTKLFSFVGGALVGSCVEYACSLFQELIFGSVSWDYSAKPFNLHGRICLQYSVYWGVLGVIWIKDLYPRMARWILKIPNRLGKAMTVALAGFMVFNTVLTGLCMLRWTERRENRAPDSRLEAYIDERYPDERMERIFSNLVFKRESGES